MRGEIMIRKQRTMCDFAAAAAALLLCVGCGGGSEGRLPTSPVTGTVSVDGKPIAGAAITFHPVEEEGTRPAFATTNDDGEFSLTTYDDGDGAVPGEYEISITKKSLKPEVKVEQLTPSGPDNPGGGDMYAKMMVGNRRESAAKDSGTIPGKYQDPKTSGLKRTVEPSGGNEFNFNLSATGS